MLLRLIRRVINRRPRYYYDILEESFTLFIVTESAIDSVVSSIFMTTIRPESSCCFLSSRFSYSMLFTITAPLWEFYSAISLRRARKKSDITPPGSFTKYPLTPPPSEQKSGTSVERIIQEIKSRRSSRSFSTNTWLRYKLSLAKYIDVEQRLQRDSFVEDKVRYYCSIPMDGVQHNLLIYLDSITFRRQGFLCFGCHLCCIKNLNRALSTI